MTVLFITYSIDTYNNPATLGLFRKLVDRGVKIIVAAQYNRFVSPIPEVKHIDIYISDSIKTINPFKWIKHRLRYYYQIFKIIKPNKPDLLIGVDAKGITLARECQRINRLLRFKNVRLDFFSFEMFFGDEGAEKRKEILACRHISNLIIQDELRNELLRKENKIPNNVQSFFLPVAPLLSKSEGIVRINKPLKIREKYNLSDNIKLIIFFGSFAEWSGAEWIIHAAEASIKDTVFVIHSRFKFNERDPIQKKIIELNKNSHSIILSDYYINTAEEIIDFLKQFDAGLVFYIPFNNIYTGKNTYNIGYSSGKFSHLMAAGVPVITNNLPTYSKLNSQYNFGFVVNDKNDLVDLLNNCPDFSAYKENCSRLYHEVLDPSSAIDNYVNHIITTNSPN